ncbi:PE-PGRS family protein [Rhizobium sp. BK251]|uniref:PE-PGRS family protein n=1 Tax=Rhizobium sp. BK251 TaxID=2512125 RepID=UPI00104D8BC1|nr:PE-PGRS family protein [Rhizobium sp. BK251]TCL64638.1 hypothetical protein EV286_11459 [Rhizobium sp. BK251]
MPIPTLSDTVQLNHSDAGDASAGNGGNGYNHGDIFYQPTAYLENTQKVYGADTDVHNGSHFWQHADWEAGGGGPGGFAQGLSGTLAGINSNTGSGGPGGNAASNGNQGLTGGTDAVSVAAQTVATQTNTQVADQSATIIAGMGGNGGNNAVAVGGYIATALMHTNPHTETETTSVSNALDHFDNSFGTIDLHHLGS